MRKVLIFLAACISALMLVGCGGGKEQSVTLTIEQSGVTNNMVLEAKGDIVQTMTQTSTLPLSDYDDDTIEALKEALEAECQSVEEDLAGIEGVEYTYVFGDDEFKEEFKIDATDSDSLEKMSDTGRLPITGVSGAKISLKKTQESLTESGWTVVE